MPRHQDQDEEDRHLDRRRKNKSSLRDRRRDEEDTHSETEEESHTSDRDRRRKHSKRKKKHKESRKKSHKKDSKRRKRDRHYSDDSASDSSSKDYEERARKRKRKKKHKRSRREDSSDLEEESPRPAKELSLTQNHILTQALCRLFHLRPIFSQELPILLIRLAGGSSFDLRQMNDAVAGQCLEGVLECLGDYGVQKKDGEWVFQALPGRRDERVLLRVIRAQLDEVGVTLDAVNNYEKEATEPKVQLVDKIAIENTSDKPKNRDQISKKVDPVIENIKTMTSSLVLAFQSTDAELGSQLAGLCQTIAQGESISIDGLPDEKLKASLEAIFNECGLEKSELANDESDDEEDDHEEESGPIMGYGLPENSDESVIIRLAAIMEACRSPKRRVLGPTMPTAEDEAAASKSYQSEEEEEGPLLQSDLTNRRREPALPAHVIKAQADYRAMELKATAAGVDIPAQGGGREEWMIVPGKYDFLSSIKSGQPIKSRGFQNKKNKGEEISSAPIHPAIRAEMDAIMKAHHDARGPSLFEEHRAMKQKEKAEAAENKAGWKWNREKDLDAGRRVDKDALHMVLGGAADNLKTKFQGGFN